MKFVWLVFKNLTRNRRRSVLTILSIAVSLFIFCALASVPLVARRILADSASSVRIACHNKAGLAYPMPQSYKHRIAGIPHVVAVISQNWFGGIYDEVTDQFPNLAADPEDIEVMWPDWGLSREAVDRFKGLRTACLVGPSTMKEFHWQIGQQIMLRGTIYPFNLTLNIVGVLGGKAPPNFMLFRRDYLEELAGETGYVDNYWVRVDEAASVPKTMAALDQEFANSPAETLSESEASFLGNFIDNYRIFFQLAEMLGLVVIVTIGLVAANTAAMSIRERRTEIAVMRAIGFQSGTILFMILSESLLVALIGGVLGCGAAFLTFKFFSIGAVAAGPLANVRVSPQIVAETMILAALIGIVSAFVPAYSATRRNIVEALRMVA
jgi:putative ABC transport system permease protein